MLLVNTFGAESLIGPESGVHLLAVIPPYGLAWTVSPTGAVGDDGWELESELAAFDVGVRTSTIRGAVFEKSVLRVEFYRPALST